MAAVHGGAIHERPWSDLPADLLSAIYLRSTSAYNRARFAAVCSTWRAAAAWHLRLPALPLLLPSTGNGRRDKKARAYSPEDGRALRVPLPWFPWGNLLVGSYQGGWIATVSTPDGLLVVNIFSGARAALLSIDKMTYIQKVVFSKDPSSPDCIIAAMHLGGTVALRSVGWPDGSRWATWRGRSAGYCSLLDIAFCNGDLYGITSGELYVFKVGLDKEGALLTFPPFRVDVAMSSIYTAKLFSLPKYIFELHGNLAIAVEVVLRGYGGKQGEFFRVFKLVDNDTTTSLHTFTWAEVTTLGDHALFLGSANCKVEQAGRRGGVEGNRIYYYKEHIHPYNNMVRLDMGSCTVHCSESSSKHHLERILSQGYHYCHDRNGANSCVWLWPPDF